MLHVCSWVQVWLWPVGTVVGETMRKDLNYVCGCVTIFLSKEGGYWDACAIGINVTERKKEEPTQLCSPW